MKYSLSIFSSLIILSVQSSVYAFESYDPRSMGMGGVGVAVPGIATAPLFNPALLSTDIQNQGLFITLPTLGGRAQDSDEFFDSVDDYQDDEFVDSLSSSLEEINSLDTSTTLPEYLAALSRLSDDTQALESAIDDLSGKMVSATLGGAFIAGRPDQEYGFSFILNGHAEVAGVINYTDSDKQDIQDLLNDFSSLERCLNEDPDSCASQSFRWYEPDTSDFSFDPYQDLDSNINVRAFLVSEIGISLSRLFDIDGYPVAIGVTPKYVQATVIDYVENIDDADEDDTDSDDYTKEYSDFNLDVGATVALPHGVFTGITIKNIIPREYDTYNILCRDGDTPKANGFCNKTKTGDSVEMSPEVRAGISMATDWYVVAADLDLTKNDQLNLGEESQYQGFGGELSAMDWLNLRVGYRFNLPNSDHNIASVGFGLSPGWFNLDVAVSGSGNNKIGASAQLSLQF